MDFHGKKYERGSNWSEPEVVELLQLWSDEAVQNELESCLRNQHVFNRIAVALHGRGIYRTGDQCREKIKKLKLEYRRIKENQKTLRGGRAWKFYEVIDRVLSNRATSSSYSAMWGSASVHQVPPGSTGSDPYSHSLHSSAFATTATGTFMFNRPPNPGELMEIKREDLNTDEELLSSDPTPQPELLYQIGSEDEPDADSKSAGPDTEELSEMARGEGPAHTGSSPSAFSEHNVAGSSGTGISPATAAVVTRDGGSHSETEDPKGSGTFRQRKRRRAGRVGRAAMGGSRLLESALAGFLSWQRVMEERYLSLEEARLQQEARAEERRVQQEERRAKQEREHELRLLSIFAGALSGAGGGTAQGTAAACAAHPGPTLAAAVATEPEAAPAPELSPSPRPERHPSPGTATVPRAPSMLRADQMPQHSIYLSRRGNSIRQHQGILQKGYALYHSNQYDESSNPGGIVNMGTSENKLCFDLLKERLAQPDMHHTEPSLLQYSDWKGHRFLREEMAKFLSEQCRSLTPLEADNVVVMNGCGSLFCAVAAVLCDPDDAILIPTPFYGAVTEDLSLYCGVKLYHVPLDSTPLENDDRPFHLTAEKLEQALQRAKHQGVNVRALILINPHNPLGDIYTPEEMTSFLKLAKEHELHVIVDEIYMLSVFGEDDCFHSVLSLDRLPDPHRTHVFWGVSKDFAMSGVRMGMVYSVNRDVLQALDQLCYFHGVAGSTQHQVAQLLRDREWLNGVFLPETRRRLREAHRYVSSQLKRLGIPYLHRASGFFIWADFSKCLKEHTFTEELRVWRCFLKHRVLLSCGQAFSCSSPGWFRIIFSDHQCRLQLGLQRIRETLEELQGSSIMPDCEDGDRGDGEEGCRQTERITETEDKSDEDTARDTTSETFSTPTRVHCGGNSAEAKRSSLADEDFVVFNGQSSSNPESLDSLIGALRQQIHSSNWLEKNRPELAPGEDLTQVNVFKDLLDRARM